jgi:hypothetical protein
MFYRESGVFKTSYAADMALMPLPSTRWTAVALGVLFIGIAPLVCDDYSMSILNLILIAVVGAIGLNIWWLHRSGLDRAWRIHVGQRLHRRTPDHQT